MNVRDFGPAAGGSSPRDATQPAFDEYLRLAAQICETPMAILSVFDDTGRQSVRASIGVEKSIREWVFRVIPTRHEELVIAPDVSQDPRLAAPPNTGSEQRIRSFASAPLIAADAAAIGSLCVLDTQPRILDARQQEALTLLARRAALEVGLRRRITEQQEGLLGLAERQHRFDFIADRVPLSITYIDADERIRYHNKALDALLGPSGEMNGLTLQEVMGDQVYAEARDAVQAALAGHEVRYERSQPAQDGNLVHLAAHYVPDVDTSGRVRGFVSALTDITEQVRAHEELNRVNVRLQRTISELEARQRQHYAFDELGDMLHTCQTQEEACAVIKRYAEKLFPDSAGGLYLRSHDLNLFQEAAEWGAGSVEPVFRANDCWALRRGRTHQAESAEAGLHCRHVGSDVPAGGYVCALLAAQGETMGVLHVRRTAGGGERLGLEIFARWVTAVAGHLALAFANLHLRETLRVQAMHDPLTGLYNRRYMEQELEREVLRCRRKSLPMSVIMVDIDHFKQFNDTYGHDAGDVVLRAVGGLLKSKVRGEDFVCRYGGEEFLLVLPGTSLELASERAVLIRDEAKQLAVQHAGAPLPAITLSLGVAWLPEHGTTVTQLLNTVDAALYAAKKAGRDRVAIGE